MATESKAPKIPAVKTGDVVLAHFLYSPGPTAVELEAEVLEVKEGGLIDCSYTRAVPGQTKPVKGQLMDLAYDGEGLLPRGWKPRPAAEKPRATAPLAPARA